MKVIINADDLGMSPEVNEAIFDLMSKGIVTSATILANGPSVQDAIAGSACFSSCSFGVHLNLTEFSPLSQSKALTELLNSQGQFSGVLETAPQKIKKTKALIRAIIDEWSCQIESVLNRGVHISHLDSHQHVHTIPFVFPALKFVQAKFGIRKVRLTRNVFKKSIPTSTSKWLAKAMYNVSLRHMYTTRTTQAFLDFTTFYERVIVGGDSWSSVEVMVHPGSRFDADENQLLESNWKELLSARNELISYNEL
jgi:predicted glycoside hydrolase/deacetylase ChbG (UPF0249 family)